MYQFALVTTATVQAEEGGGGQEEQTKTVEAIDTYGRKISVAASNGFGRKISVQSGYNTDDSTGGVGGGFLSSI